MKCKRSRHGTVGKQYDRMICSASRRLVTGKLQLIPIQGAISADVFYCILLQKIAVYLAIVDVHWFQRWLRGRFDSMVYEISESITLQLCSRNTKDDVLTDSPWDFGTHTLQKGLLLVKHRKLILSVFFSCRQPKRMAYLRKRTSISNIDVSLF